jgi:hypothetical protein
MNAAEARKIAEDLNDDKTKTALNHVYSEIKSAAIKGEFSLNYYKTLPKKAIDKLRIDGYSVNSESQYNESWYCISWKKPTSIIRDC